MFRIFLSLLLLSLAALPAAGQDTQELIEQALLPLPESLRSETGSSIKKNRASPLHFAKGPTMQSAGCSPFRRIFLALDAIIET